MRLLQTLKKHTDAITSGAAILGVLVGALGFWIMIHQLIETKRTLQASNAYEIQRDARDLVDGLLEEGDLERLIAGQEVSDESESRVKGGLWRMNNFYLSVFRQSKAGGITEAFAESFANDFCTFYREKEIGALWEQMLSEKRIGQAHLEMKREWCE